MKKRILIRRFSEILSILFKYGFLEFISRVRKHSRLPFHFRKEPKDVIRDNIGKPFAIRIRLALEELGPTFIKLGQMLSMRPDILPQNIILELQKLQDQVPPFSIKGVREIIEHQFGKPFEGLFQTFSETPDAAASIAQVHRALLPSGVEVAVKVQRPRIEELILVDLEILSRLAELAERSIPEIALFNPKGIVNEFRFIILHELDFLKEGRNIESFQKYFQNDPTVHIPAVHWNYCTEKILTMEYIRGIKISEREKLEKSDYDLKLIARRGVDVFFRQIFELGFFHADPHSGNIFILPGNVIAPIDFGMVGFVNEFLQEKLGRALAAFIQRDPRGLVKVLSDLELIEDGSKSRELTFDIEHFINYYYNISLSQLNLGTVIMELIDIIRKHQVKIPSDLVLLGKALATVESLGKELDPKLDIQEIAKPYVKKLMFSNVNPFRRLKDTVRFINDSHDLIRSLPEDTAAILKKLRNDKLKIKFEHTGLDYYIKDIDKASNRLSFSVIIAAFLIGSSLITYFDKGPTLFGVPIIGFVGYLLAGILGIWLIIGIIRSGRL